jgi:hypothetical protein
MEALQIRLVDNIERWFDLIGILIDSLEEPTKSSISDVLDVTRELFLATSMEEILMKLKYMPSLNLLELNEAVRCLVELLNIDEFHFDVFFTFIEKHTETKDVACALISQLDIIRTDVLNL